MNVWEWVAASVVAVLVLAVLAHWIVTKIAHRRYLNALRMQLASVQTEYDRWCILDCALTDQRITPADDYMLCREFNVAHRVQWYQSMQYIAGLVNQRKI